jgi:hypothetical protein
MIMKNEEQVIERCLASVRPHVDAWCIVDTGSTDTSMARATSMMRDLPGALHQRQWANFAHNRTEALALAREVCEENKNKPGWDPWGPMWLLLIDADEALVAPDGWKWPKLERDAYEIEVVPDGSDMRFTRHLMLRASAPWRFEGVIHEDIARDLETATSGFRGGVIPGIHVLTRRDGARQRNPRKYLDDAETLKGAMSRQAFYLAQSYFDHWAMTGDSESLEEAARRYEDRATMPGWDQETWQAVFKVAQCKELLGRPAADVVEGYLVAYGQRPQRAESLAALSSYLRRNGHPVPAELFAREARSLPLPADSMYVDRSAYSAPDVRIGIITAPRAGASTLGSTLSSAIASDALVMPDAVHVFADMTQDQFVAANPGSWFRVKVALEDPVELAIRHALGGVYGTLNLARSLAWASKARDVAVTLEDDVLCSRSWLSRAMALLEAVERELGLAVVLSLHDMHPQSALGRDVARVGDDSARAMSISSFPNGSQGYMMRPATAGILAERLRHHMEANDPEERRAWAMDVGITRLCCEESIAALVFADPCLLLHQHDAPSTWATGPEGRWASDEEHKALRRTLRWRPW